MKSNNERARKEGFEAQKALLDYLSSLSRTKATQIFSIVVLYFVYFQIILDNKVLEIINQIPLGRDLTLLVFGILNVVFIWQIIGLFWYVRMENVFFDEQTAKHSLEVGRQYPDAIQRLKQEIIREAGNQLRYRIILYMSGFNAYFSPTLPGDPSMSIGRRAGIALIVGIFYWGLIFLGSYFLISRLVP